MRLKVKVKVKVKVRVRIRVGVNPPCQGCALCVKAGASNAGP